jgi:hypothetical protein
MGVNDLKKIINEDGVNKRKFVVRYCGGYHT